MTKMLRLALMLLALAAPVCAFAGDTKPFAREDLASDAVRLTETLRKETTKIAAQFHGRDDAALMKAAVAAATSSDYKSAAQDIGAAIAAQPKAPAAWLALAKLGVAADDAKAEDRYELVTRATTAAYAAYQFAKDKPTQADALAALGNLEARNESWRIALDAYRASLDRKDDEDVRATYEDLREKHGFRIVDYKVDNEAAEPRVCFNFSDPLAQQDRFRPLRRRGRRDQCGDLQRRPAALRRGPQARRALPHRHSPGPAFDGRRKPAEGRRLRDLCEGPLAAGAFRRPSLCAAPPRPARRAADHGQHGEGVGRRLSRRRPQSARAKSRRTISSSRSPAAAPASIESQDGAKVWSGAMDVASVLNKDVVTDFPLQDAVGKLQPGLYLIAAKPWAPPKPAGSEDEETAQLATQWMVVSDLGLTTLSGADGVHAIVRSLAHCGAARRRRAAARRPQQRSAGDQDDRRRRPRRFRPRPVARDRRPRARPCWWRRWPTTTASSA